MCLCVSACLTCVCEKERGGELRAHRMGVREVGSGIREREACRRVGDGRTGGVEWGMGREI